MPAKNQLRSSPLKYRRSTFNFFGVLENTRKRGKRRNLDQTALAQDLQFRILLKNYAKVIFDILLKFFFPISTKGANGSFLHEKSSATRETIRGFPEIIGKKGCFFVVAWQRKICNIVQKTKKSYQLENVFRSKCYACKRISYAPPHSNIVAPRLIFFFLCFGKHKEKRKKKKLRLDSVSARLIVSHSIKELRKSNIRYFA